MGFFEIIILGFIINYLASKFNKKKDKDNSLGSIKNKVIEGFEQMETMVDQGKYPNLTKYFATDLESDTDEPDNIESVHDQPAQWIVDPTIINRLQNKYRHELQALPKNLKNQINRLIEEGPQAVKDKAIQLSAYHPNREKLLEIANYFEYLVNEEQEDPSKGDLIAKSSTVTEDFNDFSDMEYEMEPFIIEGEEIAEFSQPLQVERLKTAEDSNIHSNQLKEAIIWSEILARPKSMRK
ncbi:hypothetical protein [Facklamia miroungae]|uniref:Uncharacterized protein n=1 Tax=Facklamia miroungae TaxID=120956 RepID=A0A1G7P2I2_9LACT|nr:hypothetical protein [Facklamia miroungae]NKZ28560.1 hypothetical protein [Facklamia miroungae]SDF80518.1 hypothetical protein SAMN05421791_101101 [Facklamia miroungae]